MNHLNKNTLKSLTKLSRIDCTEEEQEQLLKDLEEILSYVEKLQAIDTENVKPCNHVLENLYNVVRDDTIEQTFTRDEFLANAPSHIGGMIRVPPVIKQS